VRQNLKGAEVGKTVEGRPWSGMTKVYGLAKKPGLHTDPGTPGFGLRVSPQGKAVWFIRASTGSGKARKEFNKTVGELVPLGEEADGVRWFDLEQARRAALTISSEEKLPEQDKQKLRLKKSSTLRSVLPEFLKNRRVRGRKTPLSEASKKNYQQVFDLYMTKCADWSLVEMQGAVRQWLEAVRDIADNKSVSKAFAMMNLVSGVYDYLELHEEVEKNPMRKVRRLFEQKRPAKRESHVEAVNLPVFVQQAFAVRNKASRTALLLDIFSGLRKSALLGLKWDWLDLNAGIIKVPEQAPGWKGWHGSFQLGQESCRLLKKWREETANKSDWVFPARHGSQEHMVDIRGALSYACKGIEQQIILEDGTVRLQDYCLHDVRRTVGTIIALLYPGDVQLAGALLAHKWAIPDSPETDITLRYQSTRQQQLHALDQVAAFVLEIAGTQPMSERTKAALDRVGIDPRSLKLETIDDELEDNDKPKKKIPEIPWFLEKALTEE
jgi:integrase